jgi:AmmeMemoRadiSam system protein A
MAAMGSTKKADDDLSAEELKLLLIVARNAIERKLNGLEKLTTGGIRELAGRDAERLSQKRGAFVTLTIGKSLRGCIGSLQAEKPLIEAVYSNALNAAFSDPRFMPLTKKEFGQVKIEVSVLSPLSRLEYRDADDLLSKLVPHKHGVLLEFSNGAGSTFLPQVWEQLPDAAEFLSHLSAKAGMPADSWRRSFPTVLVYTVQAAEEGKTDIR